MLLLRDEVIRSAMQGVSAVDGLEAKLARPLAGALELPPRMTIEDAHTRGFLRLMPCIAYDTGFAGYKAMNMHPEHGVRYVISLISLADGELVAMLDADWITAFRTAATAAIAVRHLMPAQPSTVTVLGSGTQARALLEATAQVMRPDRVLVHSPTAANRELFAEEASAELSLDVQPASDAHQALRAADVILSAYRAGAEPAIGLADVRDGALVCGISSVRPTHREVDLELWRASRVVVDDLEHVRTSGDGRVATSAGLTGAADVAELWQVLQDPALRRRDSDDRLLFKSVGTAEQDIALAALVLERCQEIETGEMIDGFPALRPIQTGRPRQAMSGDAVSRPLR